MESSARKNAFSHKVIRNADPESCPRCPHGPMLMFERMSSTSSLRFFACSAFRSRNDCAFYLLEKDVTKKKMLEFSARSKQLTTISYADKYTTLKRLMKNTGQTKSIFCHSCCCCLENQDEVKLHKGHTIFPAFSLEDSRRPTKVLTSLNDNTKEAQYFFSNESRAVIISILTSLKVSTVISIGTPSLLESLSSDVDFYLLDLDWRYGSFYGERFSPYNMFNHHFLETVDDPDGNLSQNQFRSFLQNSQPNDPIAILLDPPFGGRVEPIADSLKKVVQLAREVGCSGNVFFFWVFPYFSEPYLNAELGVVNMLDYRVNYCDHKMFNQAASRRGRKLGSPIRIFTNAPSSKISLPKDEGYYFCDKCQSYRHCDNIHCDICETCPSKAGGTYKHCVKCSRCVKPRWIHCDVCNKCCTIDHPCSSQKAMQKSTKRLKKR